jgi:hypothetical protein
VSVRLPSEDDPEDAGIPEDDGDRREHGADLEVEHMLTRWRGTLPAGPTDARLLAAVTATVAVPRERRRFPKLTAGVAAGVFLTVGSITAAAAQAGPDSPLWPITQLVFGDLAESRTVTQTAEDTLRDAKAAAERGDAAEAARLLAKADELTERITEPAAAGRVRDAIAALRDVIERGAGTTSRSDVDGRSATPTPTGDRPPADATTPDSPKPDPRGPDAPPSERPGSSSPVTESPGDLPQISLPPETSTPSDPSSTPDPSASVPPSDLPTSEQAPSD